MSVIALTFCDHDKLLELDQRGAYTAISNDVMLHLLSTPAIAPAIRLWLLIRFQQSGFKDRRFVERPIAWLAKSLCVSTSTIQKWQRKLEEAGYLEIIEQKNKRLNNRPNRYRACLPKFVEALLSKEQKQRRVYTEYPNIHKTSSTREANERLSINNKEDIDNAKKENPESDNPAHDTAIDDSALPNNDRGEGSPQKKEEIDKVEPSHIAPNKITTRDMTLANVAPNIARAGGDHDAEPGKTGEQSIKLELSQDLKQQIIQCLDTHLTHSEMWLSPLLTTFQYQLVDDTLWITGPNQYAQRILNNYLTKLQSTLSEKQLNITRIAYNLDQPHLKAQNQDQSETNTTNRSGSSLDDSKSTIKRSEKTPELKKHTQYRILKRLRSLSINGEQLSDTDVQRLGDEISFAITAGSLNSMAIPKAINVAIKLIRLNQWRTPAGYPQGGRK